jgi:pimeloyl-ACP methyl ester carboxylesterase
MSFHRCIPGRAGWLLALWLGFLGGPVLGADPDSFRVTGVDRSGGPLTVHWNDAGPGFVYSVQSRQSLDEGIWLTRSQERPWPTPALQWQIDLDDEAARSFYRVLAVPAATRGDLISITALPSLSLFEIGFLFVAAEIPVVPQHAVDVYKIVYETIDPWGGRTQASGAFLLPQNPVTAPPLVSYQHATPIRTNNVPSASLIERIPGVGFATLGYAVAMPDYLGLGDSPGFHPYHHAQSQATACVDFLRAIRAWCSDNEILLDEKLFLAGYSQGGHATLALQRELETHHPDEFNITASAPMAGAYDLSGVTAADLLSGRSTPNPAYLLYQVAAYQAVYGLAGSLADLLDAPYDTTLPPLLNGDADIERINEAMPASPIEILQPDVLARIQSDANHPLRVALRDNDLIRWTPVAPTRLYHCPEDQDVLHANSVAARDAFHARGATHVELIEPDPVADHGGCILPAFLLARDWFESLRE